nr:hypothetical protein [Tanacetum cinerariifolium]
QALDRLMVSKYESLNEPYNVKKTQNREAFFKMRKKELELKEQELRMREYEHRQKDEMFYMGPTDHLSGVNLNRALEMTRAIKER